MAAEGNERSRLRRIFGLIRRNRHDDGVHAELSVGADLGADDLARLREVVDAVLSRRGGEVAARRRVAVLAEAYLGLNRHGQASFFSMLAEHYDTDPVEVDAAVQTLREAVTADDRRGAEVALRSALLSPREHLLRRFVSVESGLSFLVHLRGDLLALLSTRPALAPIDEELKRLLGTWFDVGFLELTSITWDTPASLLEKLIDYEAVHEITSWADLRNRLGPDRRCYAFSHPAMADDLLIFVQVAFTKGLADNIVDLLDPSATDGDPGDADTAIFYSISNCQEGLAGVRLGDFLIKRVAQELSAVFPHLETFATLSPMPGFRAWLTDQLSSEGVDTLPGIATADDPRRAAEELHFLLSNDSWFATPGVVERAEPLLRSLAAHYLTAVRRGQRALDPVAHFHLSNGARVERLQFLANPTATGISRALGMMVNYRYDLSQIESNVDRYLTEGVVARSGEIDRAVGA